MKFTLTGLLIVANVAAYVWQKTTSGGIDHDHGYLSPQQVLQYGEWWRIFSAAFLHGNETHIALNMLGLYWLGSAVEGVFGKVRFALLYAVAIVGSGLAVVYFSAYATATLGASGAIYGLIGALGAIGLRLGSSGRGLLLRMLPMVVINLGFTFAFPFISAAAHVGGLIAGFLAGLVLFVGRRPFAERYAAMFAQDPRSVAPVAAPHADERALQTETIEQSPHVRDPRE